MPGVQYVDVDVEVVAIDEGDAPLPDQIFQHGTFARNPTNVGGSHIGDVRNAFNRLEQQDQIPITEAEIVQPAGIGGAEATFKTWLDDPFGLQYAVTPYTEVTLRLSINEHPVFTGTVQKVTQDEEGIITITSMDARAQLNRYTVRLETREEGQPSTKLVRDFLIEEGPFTADEVHIDIDDPVTIQESFGTNNRKKLVRVLKFVAERDGATFWVDRNNEIHYSDIPVAHRIPLEFITSLNAGSSKTDNTTVIAEGPATDSPFNFFGNNHTTHTQTRATASKGKEDNRMTLHKDNNLRSVDQNANMAVSTMASSDIMKRAGEIELLGEPRITAWDQVLIGEEDVPEWSPIARGTYTVQEVTHTLSPSDGFLTTLKVGQSLEQVYAWTHDTRGVADRKQEKSAGILEKVLDWTNDYIVYSPPVDI